MNKTILIGHVGADDATLSVTTKGTAVANFNLATNESYRDENGEWQTITTWFKVTAWGKQAKRVAEKVTRGRFLYLEGAVRKHTWAGQDGQERTDLALRLNYIRFLDKAKESEDEDIRTDDEPFDNQY